MKRNLYFVSLFLFFFSLKGIAAIPEGAIPFIFDRHLYFQCTLNDTIPVTLIYDTGADFLYLDQDYLKVNNLQNAFGRKGRAKIGGAGNSGPQSVEIFIEPVKIHCGDMEYQNKITPIIKLRDILGRHTDGLLGNTHLLTSPLEINFSEGYIKQLKKPFKDDLLDNYIKLDARFEKNRIDVKAKLQIDEKNTLEGWFRMDLGCGSSICLTNEAASSLNIDDIPKAYFRTQAGGIGGGSDQFIIRAAQFCMTIIRKTKRFAIPERAVYFLKTKRTAGVLPHPKIFSTGLRRYSHNARTESGHHPNPVLFVLSLRSRFSRFALRSLDYRLIRSHALRPHEFAAEGQARADIRIRTRGIVMRKRIRDTAIRVRIAAPAIDHTASGCAYPVQV